METIPVYQVTFTQKEYEHMLKIAPDGIQRAMQSSLKKINLKVPALNFTPIKGR